MRHKWTSHAGRWLAALLLTVMGALLLAEPARAAASTPRAAADTVTLTLDNSTATFVYGQTPVPTFTAVVTFGTRPAANHPWGIVVQIDDGGGPGSNEPTSSSDGMTLTFSRLTASTTIKPGLRTATASFKNLDTGVTTNSNPVTFTVNKATPYLVCSIDGAGLHFVGVGQTLHVRLNTGAQPRSVSEDWQNGTATVTFDGPTHITRPNLVPDSNGEVTLSGPTQNGKYTLTCAFSGTSLFTSATYTDTFAYTFSAMQSPSSVQLFTNPTTLAAQQNLDFYVVFHAAPGSPAPTGEYQIWIGNYYTNSMRLSANGDARVSLTPLGTMNGVNQITIRYWGDIYYNEATFNFPLTNPPIPGGAGGGGTNGGGGSSGGGGAWGNATATASTTGTPGATQTATSSGNGVSSATPPTNSNGMFWLIGGLVLLVLAGLGTTAGIVFFRARRAKSPPGAGRETATDTPDRSPVPFQW